MLQGGLVLDFCMYTSAYYSTSLFRLPQAISWKRVAASFGILKATFFFLDLKT